MQDQGGNWSFSLPCCALLPMERSVDIDVNLRSCALIHWYHTNYIVGNGMVGSFYELSKSLSVLERIFPTIIPEQRRKSWLFSCICKCSSNMPIRFSNPNSCRLNQDWATYSRFWNRVFQSPLVPHHYLRSKISDANQDDDHCLPKQSGMTTTVLAHLVHPSSICHCHFLCVYVWEILRSICLESSSKAKNQLACDDLVVSWTFQKWTQWTRLAIFECCSPSSMVWSVVSFSHFSIRTTATWLRSWMIYTLNAWEQKEEVVITKMESPINYYH